MEAHPFDGKVMRLGFFPIPPWSEVVGQDENGPIVVGTSANIYKVIADTLNVTLQWKFPKDGDFGEKLPNGSVYGMYGELVNREIDAIAGPFIYEAHRQPTIKISTYIYSTALAILASEGQIFDVSFTRFIFTFEGPVWGFIFLAMICLIIVTSLVDNYGKGTKKTSITKTANTYTWIYLASFFSEGSPRDPHNTLSRILLAIWLLGILILNYAFCGQFKALLMVQNNDDIIKSVKDLADRPNLVVSIPKRTIMQEVFQFSPLEDYQRVWQNVLMQEDKCLRPVITYIYPEVYQSVKDGEAVSICDQVITRSILSAFCPILNGSRTYYWVEETFYSYQYNVVVREDFPEDVLEKINRKVESMVQSHLVEKWLEKYSRNLWKCLKISDSSQEENPMGMTHLSAMFYIVLVLQALCIVVFLLEVIYGNYVKRFSDKWDH